jgi:hypothetical protein
MARRSKARRYKVDARPRVMKVEVESNGLYVVHYQSFRGNMPVGEPYKAYMTKPTYELLEMKWILMSEFLVPEHFIEKVLDKAREVAKEDSDWGCEESWQRGYEARLNEE